MKLKRWLSRALVLAMVVALMIPVPVAAKGGGGKLVKSVTVYELRDSGRWQATRQLTYKYDKKNYPAEIGTVSYNSWFLGVPVGGTKTVRTAKYKYKGGSPKSAKFKDGAGKVTETRKYKKGKAVSVKSSDLHSSEVYEWVNDTRVFKGDDVYQEDVNESLTYNKYGLATGFVTTYNEASTTAAGAASTSTETYVGTFANTHKKGVPSMIITDRSSSGTSVSPGNTYSWQENADGSWVENSNGAISQGKDDYIYKDYAYFNGKGLVYQTGEIRIDTKTGLQVVFPERQIDYVMKKGKVTQAVVYTLTTNAQGVVTQQKATTMYQFKYAKAKANAVRYLSMVNSFVGAGGAGAFTWF